MPVINGVNFDWSNDGLKLVMSKMNAQGKSQKLTLEWDDHSEIPAPGKLVEIYNNYFETLEPTTEVYGKVLQLPFNKQLNVGTIKKADFDDALFKLGNIDISFPITKDNKLVLKAPKITRSKNFGFGAGSAKSAAWLEFKNKDKE